jgi:23S rRNA (adenine2503-C2)-methyltransferase
MSAITTKIDIRQFELLELEEWFKARGQARFRAKQVYEWLWKKSAFTFEEMTNLSKELRKDLEEHFEINPITMDKVQHSSDGTIKSRFKLHDGHLMESVLIPVPEDNRYTVCVSCQVGCSLSCAFCATGLMDRKRNLSAAEIYDQVVLVNKQCLETFDHPLTNIVYMGMGEPLLTYREVKKSIQMITSEAGLGMSPRRITVSTAGIAKMIKKMADDDLRVNLALSLHAADDTKRDKIMPINEHNNLKVLMEALQYFHLNTKNKISYEYIAFNDFNVTMQDARNLLKLCKLFPVRVNIIEYNSVEGLDFVKAPEDRINDFAKYLRDHGIMITVRRSRGKDIDAACGQLANKE